MCCVRICLGIGLDAGGSAMKVVAERHVRLFKNGKNQALRIPQEFELPGDEAMIHKGGDRLIIEPTRKIYLFKLLETW
jgi:antitoxin VapB